MDYLNNFKQELSDDSLRRLSTNPLRILDSNDIDKKILLNAPSVLDYLSQDAKIRFETVCEGLDTLNIKYSVDKNLVRGLDYYCHTTFEFITNNLGSQGTVLAGGRYDGLSKILGGIDISGVGWAAGVDRLAMMMESEYINSVDIALIGQLEKHNLLLFPILIDLINGVSKWNYIYGQYIKKIERANKIRASYAIILGEEELTKDY